MAGRQSLQRHRRQQGCVHLTGGALNDVLIGTATSTTYGWLYHWDSTSVANGAYFLQSVAYDTTGISATSAAIGITVKN